MTEVGDYIHLLEDLCLNAVNPVYYISHSKNNFIMLLTSVEIDTVCSKGD